MNCIKLCSLHFAGIALLLGLAFCAPAPKESNADLILLNGKVYTFTWDEPALDGAPAANAPHSDEGWEPDAEAIAIRGEQIAFVGSNEQAQEYRGNDTVVVDVQGATVLPGLVDSHTHVAGLGAIQSQVNLMEVETEEEVVERVAETAANVPEGQRIVARGWDEGAWANRYPTMDLLSEKVSGKTKPGCWRRADGPTSRSWTSIL